MAKRPKRMATFRLDEYTIAQIKELAEAWQMSQAEAITIAVASARFQHAKGMVPSTPIIVPEERIDEAAQAWHEERAGLAAART